MGRHMKSVNEKLPMKLNWRNVYQTVIR